jgi:hypothetical protein
MSAAISSPIQQRVALSTVNAILVALAILVPCLLVGFISPVTAKILVTVVIVGSSLWVGLESSRFNLQAYKSQVQATPFVLFTACVGLWPLIFPAYLIVRSKLLAGLLPQTTTLPPRRLSRYCIVIWSGVALIIVFVVILTYMLSAAARVPLSTAMIQIG